MSQYIQRITDSLTNLITEMSQEPGLFLKNPGKDFSRNRKIDFKTFIGITLNSGGCTMSKELLDYFDFKSDLPTVSAYTQQRRKVLPEAFEYLFREFTEANDSSARDYGGYRLIACDGSNLTIYHNPSDADTAWRFSQRDEVRNHLHLNAFYDVLNRIYVDVIVQKAAEYNEGLACIQMIERSSLKNVLLVADRGYENYNLMAHAIEKGWKFLIRIKNGDRSMAHSLGLPKDGIFDTDISLTLTRTRTKAMKNPGMKYMPPCQRFDYLREGETYDMAFRAARFAIGPDAYELVVTNLDRSSFPPEKLKEIYHLRWGIETSFRELKYAIGLTSFHARKVDYIRQEIFARLLMYNYCELITTHVISLIGGKDKTRQVNFTVAIYICREFLRQRRQLSPPEMIKLIRKHILPVRPGRKDPRKVKEQGPVSFIYRVA